MPNPETRGGIGLGASEGESRCWAGMRGGAVIMGIVGIKEVALPEPPPEGGAQCEGRVRGPGHEV